MLHSHAWAYGGQFRQHDFVCAEVYSVCCLGVENYTTLIFWVWKKQRVCWHSHAWAYGGQFGQHDFVCVEVYSVGCQGVENCTNLIFWVWKKQRVCWQHQWRGRGELMPNVRNWQKRIWHRYLMCTSMQSVSSTKTPTFLRGCHKQRWTQE